MATDQPRQFPVQTLTLTCSKDDSDVYGFYDDDDSDDGDDVDDDYDSYEDDDDDDDDDFYYVHVGLRALIRPRAFTINSVATLIRPCVRKKKPQPPHAVDWQRCYACMSTHIHHAIFTLESPPEQLLRPLCQKAHMASYKQADNDLTAT